MMMMMMMMMTMMTMMIMTMMIILFSTRATPLARMSAKSAGVSLLDRVGQQLRQVCSAPTTPPSRAFPRRVALVVY